MRYPTAPRAVLGLRTTLSVRAVLATLALAVARRADRRAHRTLRRFASLARYFQGLHAVDVGSIRRTSPVRELRPIIGGSRASRPERDLSCPSAENFQGAAEARTEVVLNAHVEQPRRLELPGARQRSRVDRAQLRPR
jgi:hypothetical protein